MSEGLKAEVPPATVLKKAFTLRSAFTLAFVFISPFVVLYGVFALVLGCAGPTGWWAFVIVLAGQLLVAAVFAQLASRWPFEGSVYQWSRRIVGEHYGWFTGWANIWSLLVAVSGGAYFIALFLPIVLGRSEPFSSGTQILVAVVVLVCVTAFNLAGPAVVKVFSLLSLIPAVAFLVHRLQGRWIAGKVSLGRWGTPVAVLASAWVVFETVNIAWPRSPQLPWYDNYVVLLAAVIVAALGVVVWLTFRSGSRGPSPRQQKWS